MNTFWNYREDSYIAKKKIATTRICSPSEGVQELFSDVEVFKVSHDF